MDKIPKSWVVFSRLSFSRLHLQHASHGFIPNLMWLDHASPHSSLWKPASRWTNGFRDNGVGVARYSVLARRNMIVTICDQEYIRSNRTGAIWRNRRVWANHDKATVLALKLERKSGEGVEKILPKSFRLSNMFTRQEFAAEILSGRFISRRREEMLARMRYLIYGCRKVTITFYGKKLSRGVRKQIGRISPVLQIRKCFCDKLHSIQPI